MEGRMAARRHGYAYIRGMTCILDITPRDIWNLLFVAVIYDALSAPLRPSLNVKIWRLLSSDFADIDGPRTERIKKYNRYSNEAERADHDIDHVDDDFKFEKQIWSPWFIQTYVSFIRVNLCHVYPLSWLLHTMLHIMYLIRLSPI